MELNAVELHDQLLRQMPEGARHDADICSICVDKAAQVSEPTTSGIPPAAGGSGVPEKSPVPDNQEGGTPAMSDNAQTISKETHEALMAKAVADAVQTTDAALAAKTTEATELAKKVEDQEAELANLKADNARLNNELDTAQVNLKAATEEVASLKADIQEKDEAARKAEIASKRAEQVRNLGLFTEEQISEKASRWAETSEDDWAERVEEWKALKPTTTQTPATEQASALTGATEEFTKGGTDTAGEQKTPARRAALGLS